MYIIHIAAPILLLLLFSVGDYTSTNEDQNSWISLKINDSWVKPFKF